MHASVYRNSRFEMRLLQQGPNQFAVVCSERAVPGRDVPRLDIHESEFTDAEMQQVQDVLAMLELKFEAVHARWENDPARMHDTIAAAVQAKADLEQAKLEQARIEAENIARRAELEELNKNLAAIQAAAAAGAPAQSTPNGGAT